MKLPEAALSGLESVFNTCLHMDPVASGRMAELQGRTLAIDLQGPGIVLYIRPGAKGVRILQSLEGDADTVLHGSPLAMAQMGLGDQANRALFAGEVTITGDIETGRAFQEILRALDIDWEEQLSRFAGDTVAHQAGRAARHLHDLLHQGRRRLEQDAGEYLQEELHVLPTRIETENFSHDVNDLVMATDRLTARVQRLLERSSQTPKA